MKNMAANSDFNFLLFYFKFILENANDIVVTWSTMDDVGANGTIVEYGINGLTFSASGTVDKFIDDGAARRAQYIHRVS